MARNEEKAQSMLNRYLQSTRGRHGENRRPYLSTLCDDVDEAIKWREQVLRDIRIRVNEIQHDSLEQTRVRELNDGINKLLRERGHWERRILTLGGPDFAKQRREPNTEDIGANVFKHNGFFYFGAARGLPGIKELIAERQQRSSKKPRHENKPSEESTEIISARLDITYYGYTADNYDNLYNAESEAQEQLQSQLVDHWEQNNSGKANDEWDDSYLNFVGQKPSVSANAEMQALALQRMKADALEHLDGVLGTK